MHIGFQQLASKLQQRPGVTNPGALAASIGRKKYGGAKMSAAARRHTPLRDAQAKRTTAAQRRKRRHHGHAKPAPANPMVA